MMMGDVVLVYIPYVDGPGGKARPAVVVQGDEHNALLPHTIVAAITTNLRNLDSPTHQLLDPSTTEGKAAGVLHGSAVRCDRLFTVERNLIRRTTGRLAPNTQSVVDDCLRSSLGLRLEISRDVGAGSGGG